MKEKVKQAVKRILTDKYDRSYERMYQRARRQSGYTNLIGELEQKQLAEWKKKTEGLSLPAVYVQKYTFGKSGELLEILQNVLKRDVVVFADDRVTLSEHAQDYIAAWFALHPETVLLYGDEDVMLPDGTREMPWLKPTWSPDLLKSCFYFGGVVCIRQSVLQEMLSGGRLRMMSGGRISHVDAVLCHHQSADDYETYLNSGLKEEELGFLETFSETRKKSPVSVIIPSKDHPELLERNLNSLLLTVNGDADGFGDTECGKAALPEIVIVDNGSSAENKEKTERLIQDLTKKGMTHVQYLYHPMPFHFSKMCNMGAKAATGELLLFLNDDVEAAESGWLDKLAAKASLSYVGAVGAKLLYPGSRKIQHAGIVNLPLGPVHKLQFQDDGTEHYFRRNRNAVNVLAVTGACLMMKKSVFMECGGFCEELPVAFNDVDLCFTLHEKGYYNVVMNDVFLYHHESLSRGDDESPEKLRRLRKECRRLYERHPDLKGTDPFYHPWLNREMLDTNILPAPEEVLFSGITRVKAQNERTVQNMRPHQGLFLRVESVSGNRCQGYAFMAGDDNACYDKRLLLESVQEDGNEIYSVFLPAKLRQDLQTNMPDQKNVALCGFDVEIEGLPAGAYRLGVAAKNNVTHVTYINRSAAVLEV